MKLSLPAKVAIGASSLAGLLTLALGGVAFEVSRSRLIAAYDQRLVAQTEDVSRHIAQVLRTIDHNLSATARNTMFANALTDSGGRDSYLAPFLKDFVEIADVPIFVELRDYRGRPIAANPGKALGAGVLIPEKAMAVMEDGRAMAWIDRYPGEGLAVAMIAPVVFANTGAPEGALLYQFPLQALLGESMSPEGELAVRVSVDFHGGAIGAVALGGGAGLSAEMLSSSRVVAMPPSFAGFGLRVEAGMARAAVDGALARLMVLHLLAATGLMAVVVPLSMVMARRVLRRLKALEAVANSVIATGLLDARVEVAGDDEITRLSLAFNHMLERLRVANEELEQERAREVARYAERTRRILATTQESYLLVSAETGRVLEINEAFCQLLGTCQDRVLDRGYPNFLRPLVEEVLAPNSPASLVREVETTRLDGTLMVCLTNASIDVDEHGARCISLFLTDISERRAAEDALQRKSVELERSNADLQQFAYAASHDLQEPLRMVTAYLKLLREKLGEGLDEEGREFMGFASDGTRRMAILIRDLLDYSRVGSRGGVFGNVDCAEAMDEALLNLRVRIEEEGAEVTVAANMPVVLGDHAQIVRLFQNIIGNAVKFRAKDRPPRIAVEVAGDHSGLCHLVVRDNGIGIDPSFHARIFEAFQRLHSRAEYEGTGLGLALVKRIVDLHHGRVWVDSMPGEGSAFHIVLPNAVVPLRQVS